MVEGKNKVVSWIGHKALSDSGAFCHLPTGLSFAVMFNNAKDPNLFSKICNTVCNQFHGIPMPIAPMHFKVTRENRHHLVRVTLIDLSKNAAEDSDSKTITQLVTKELANARLARSIFGGYPSGPGEEEGGIASRILRFSKTQDKWMAFASFMVKSQAFYLVHPNATVSRNPVELPCTNLKKPFIPLSPNDIPTANQSMEEDVFPLSVSHQFPYIGRAMIVSDQEQHGSCLKLGLDIVVFSSRENDFLDSFQENFTEREWKCIMQSPPPDRLKEFYVRWSLKEAYTKALGVGMHCDFNSFDIRLSPVDGYNSEDVDFVSGHVFSGDETSGIYFTGFVNFLSEARPRERWEVVFFPLHKSAQGCACVMIGPIDPFALAPYQVNTNWSNINSFISS